MTTEEENKISDYLATFKNKVYLYIFNHIMIYSYITGLKVNKDIIMKYTNIIYENNLNEVKELGINIYKKNYSYYNEVCNDLLPELYTNYPIDN